MKNGVNGKNKKSQNNLDTLQAQEGPTTQQRSTSSLKDKLRIPRPKSHSVGPDTVQQVRSQQQQNPRNYPSNNNEMTTLSRATADVLTISGGKKGLGHELTPSMAGSSIEIGRLGGGGSRTAVLDSGFGVGSARNSNVYTPPGVPMVD